MDSSELKRRIKEVLADELMLPDGPEKIGDDAPLFGPEGLGLDSVDALQVVVALEKHFGLKVTDAEVAKTVLQSVNSISAAIQANTPAQTSPQDSS